MNQHNSELTQNLLAHDEQFLASSLYRVFHIVAERGEGPYLYTVDGDKYLDLTSGIGVTQLGHCHPEVVQAAKEQLDKLFHVSCVTHHTKNIELAARLSEILPGNIDNTFFCNSGAEAVDGAIKFSRYVNPGRPNIIAFRPAFHGRTLGSTALSSSKTSLRKNYDPLLTGINFVDFPNCWHCPVFKDPETCHLECLDLLTRSFKLNLPPETVSAIILEPIVGEGGYLPLPNDKEQNNVQKHRYNYLRELRKICDEYGILLIADEVQSGIGRTGYWFAVNQYDVQPDVVTMAKGLANGLPIGGFAARKELMHKMPPGSHGSTFGGNPVSCAAASKTIEIIQRDNLLEYVTTTGQVVMKHLTESLKSIAKVRGYGFMIGIELSSKETVDLVIQRCFEEKMLVLSAGTNSLRVIPPLNIDEQLLMNGVDKLIGIIQKAVSADGQVL
ncbi:MAG: aminotransferase class III-fold pyridoxal phosphate-dependent enzyme [Candidatus Caenarcaniphilales bacterium]|nr:aminotransferase class III-fold pyridoxal phosphate-dependent enzyme [Candidatus Caenarcaniphilales bacterium]